MLNFVLALGLLISARATARGLLYFTDLEGSRARLERLYSQSDGFYFDHLGQAHLKPGIELVYGGDVPDRYVGSLWVTNELLRLYRENPDRVYLLAGNRDVNKLRLSNELTPAAIKRPPFHYASSNPADYAAEAGAEPNRTRRLQYIFAKTMGAPNALALLQEELGLDADATTDAYLKTLLPGGSFAQLLQVMRTGLRLESTLFLHGGATPQNVGYVPGEAREPNLDAWLNKLDSWYQTQLKVWQASPQTWNGVGPRPAEDLLEYPMPRPNERSKPESTITGRHVDLENNPLLPQPAAIAYLRANRINRLIVGHTPIGGMPITVRTPEQDFEVIFVDTSYSKAPKGNAWVWLEGRHLELANLYGQFQRPDQSWQNLLTMTHFSHPTRIGQLAPGGARIIGQVESNNYVTTRMKAFEVINELVCGALLLAK